MIDVKIEDRTVEERELCGSGFELITEVVTLTAYILGFVAKDRQMYDVLKTSLIKTLAKLEYGNIREGNSKEG